jgi:hypothetical protein
VTVPSPEEAAVVVPRGELPQRLTELLLAHAEMARAASPWLCGDVEAPLAQLSDLAARLQVLGVTCEAALEEARSVYKDTRAAYGASANGR